MTSDFNQMSLNGHMSLNGNDLGMQYNDSFNFSDDHNFEFDTFYTKKQTNTTIQNKKPISAELIRTYKSESVIQHV